MHAQKKLGANRTSVFGDFPVIAQLDLHQILQSGREKEHAQAHRRDLPKDFRGNGNCENTEVVRAV
jgi:hypothetical protein